MRVRRAMGVRPAMQVRPAVAVAAAVLIGAAGCSSSLPSSLRQAPVLSIATGLWPLAQAARQIGGDKVAVVDVVPPATDPFGFDPDPAQARILTGSGLVVDVGGGFQPKLEAAAAGAPAVVHVGAGTGATDPYVWLDPSTMAKTVTVLEKAMAAADPAAASLFARNASDVRNEIQSLGIDYSSTLAACPGTRLVTPDGAFTAMAAEYGLTDHVVGPDPSPATVNLERSYLQSGRPAGLITEPWVDNHGVEAVAAAAGVGTHAVDTLATTPTGPTGSGQDPYFAQMERLLSQLAKQLGCSTSEQ